MVKIMIPTLSYFIILTNIYKKFIIMRRNPHSVFVVAAAGLMENYLNWTSRSSTVGCFAAHSLLSCSITASSTRISCTAEHTNRLAGFLSSMLSVERLLGTPIGLWALWSLSSELCRLALNAAFLLVRCPLEIGTVLCFEARYGETCFLVTEGAILGRLAICVGVEDWLHSGSAFPLLFSFPP